MVFFLKIKMNKMAFYKVYKKINKIEISNNFSKASMNGKILLNFGIQKILLTIITGDRQCAQNKLPVKVRLYAYIIVGKLTYNYRQLIFRANNSISTYQERTKTILEK